MHSLCAENLMLVRSPRSVTKTKKVAERYSGRSATGGVFHGVSMLVLFPWKGAELLTEH